MEEIEVPAEAQAILLVVSGPGDSAEAREVWALYQGKAQNGNKLVGQDDGIQIKYDQAEDQFYQVT